MNIPMTYEEAVEALTIARDTNARLNRRLQELEGNEKFKRLKVMAWNSQWLEVKKEADKRIAEEIKQYKTSARKSFRAHFSTSAKKLIDLAEETASFLDEVITSGVNEDTPDRQATLHGQIREAKISANPEMVKWPYNPLTPQNETPGA